MGQLLLALEQRLLGRPLLREVDAGDGHKALVAVSAVVAVVADAMVHITGKGCRKCRQYHQRLHWILLVIRQLGENTWAAWFFGRPRAGSRSSVTTGDIMAILQSGAEADGWGPQIERIAHVG